MDELKSLRASDFASEQEYEAKRQEIINHYTQMSRGVLYEIEDLTHQSAIVNKEYNIEMADTYHETLIGKMYPTYDNFKALEIGINDAIKSSMSTLGVAYIPKPTIEETVLYRVQVGAFRNRDYAEAYLKKVQDAGFPDAFIAKVTK